MMERDYASQYEDVIAANRKVHSVLAEFYNDTEPHFRPENVSYVDKKLRGIFAETNAKRLLDLGCGTGFIINIAKKYVQEIDGVDVTEAMLRRVDRTGNASIRVHQTDTGSFKVEEGSYDVATAYSFLHHLYDIAPTLRTAAKALRVGGKFYVDLEPNFYFWDAIGGLQRNGVYDPILMKEIASLFEKDEEIQEKFKVDKNTFNTAEYNKAITGGFSEEALTTELLNAGFKDVQVSYYWFLGQASIVNDPNFDRSQTVVMADLFAETLKRGLPLTRNLFKYVGFLATR